jgi:predicted phage terminase large subunit-like protein
MNFLGFVIYAHQVIENEAFIVKYFHHDICDLLTQCAHRTLPQGIYILILNMPFRYSKTKLIIYYMIYCFLMNERAKFIYTTYSEKLSLRTSREVKNGLTLNFGRKASLSKDSAHLWETKSGGGLWATTMQGSVTGFGAGDIYCTPCSGDLIMDDPQKAADAFYETKRNTLNENISNTFWSRRNNLDRIPIILIQQRLHPDDTSNYLMQKYPNSYIRYCVKGIDDDGESSFPERVSKETLLDLKQASSYTYYSQVQQEPKGYAGNFFLVDQTQIISVKEFREKEWLMKAFVRSWDFAGIKKESKPSEKHDYTRGVLTCTDGQMIYILDVATHRGTVDQNALLLTKKAKEDGPRVIITVPEDPGVAGQAYVDYLQTLPDLGGYTLNPIRPTQNKQLRAAGFASFLNRGNVVLVDDSEDGYRWNALLLEELASFPFSTHDDQVDCLSDAFNFLHNINKYI